MMYSMKNSARILMSKRRMVLYCVCITSPQRSIKRLVTPSFSSTVFSPTRLHSLSMKNDLSPSGCSNKVTMCTCRIFEQISRCRIVTYVFILAWLQHVVADITIFVDSLLDLILVTGRGLLKKSEFMIYRRLLITFTNELDWNLPTSVTRKELEPVSSRTLLPFIYDADWNRMTKLVFLALSRGMRPDLGNKISGFVALGPAVYAGPVLRSFPFSIMRKFKARSLWSLIFGGRLAFLSSDS